MAEKSALEQDILAKTKTAMKEKNVLARTVLRAISGELKQKKIDGRLESLTEAEELAIIKRMIKQRKDSVQQFTEGGREDLAAQEQAEIAIVEQFLPQQMTEAEIEVEVDKAIAVTGADSPQMMGKVMGALGHIRATADMGVVSKIVKSKL